MLVPPRLTRAHPAASTLVPTLVQRSATADPALPLRLPALMLLLAASLTAAVGQSGEATGLLWPLPAVRLLQKAVQSGRRRQIP